MTRLVRAIAVAILLCASSSFAGEDAPTVRELHGFVSDETGGAIPSATVVFVSAGGAATSTVSDARGQYRLTGIPSGAATLTITHGGFADFKRDLAMPASGSRTIDARLRVAMTQHVDVTSPIGLSLAPDRNLSTLTLSGRNLDALPEDPQALLQTLRMMVGSRTDLVAVYVDGMPLGQRLPAKNAIQSIRLNADPFAAEYPEPGNGRIEIVTKPASQEFHGNARVDFNDDRLNARNAFDPDKAAVQLRTYSGYIGGPVVPNRWGFLLYGGRWDQDENVVVNATPLDPSTLQPVTLRTNVAAPVRTTSFSVKTDVLVADRHTLAVEFNREEKTSRNAGLEGGFDLPERAYTGSSLDQAANAWVTSTFSIHLLNELRFHAVSSTIGDHALTTSPAVLVLQAFNAGGNQTSLRRDNSTRTQTLTDTFTWAGTAHTVRAGGRLDRMQQDLVDASNFGGTFVFGSDFLRTPDGQIAFGPTGEPTAMSALDLYRNVLAHVPGYAPSQFSIANGDPSTDFNQWQAAWFAQDDWRATRQLTISYGARNELQTGLGRRLSVAPRAGIAWAPSEDGRGVIRAGVGLFYTRVPLTIFSDVLRLDGIRGAGYEMSSPSFFPNLPPNLAGLQQLDPVVRVKADDLQAPAQVLGTVSYDRQFGRGIFTSAGYSWRHGNSLLRTRNINAPLAAPGILTEGGPILQFESTGRLTSHELRAVLNATIGSRLTLFAHYTLADTRTGTDGPYTAPANSYRPDDEMGPAVNVPRHEFTLGGSIGLPGGLAISPFITAASSIPFNITTGADNNGDSLFTDRPSFAQSGDRGAIVTAFGVFNPNPLPGEALVPRNYGNGPSLFRIDLTIIKALSVRSKGANASLGLTATNLTNQVNYMPFNGVLTSPFFGAANRAQDARRVTLFGRVDF